MQKTTIIFLIFAALHSSDIYNSLKTDVLVLTQQNWMNQVVKGRQTEKIFLVHFFNENDGKSYEFSKGFTEKAAEFKGIVNFGFVNCSKQKQLCQKEAPKTLPALKIYAPNPEPTQEFELDLKKALNIAISFLKFSVTEVKEENAGQFLRSDVGLPKALLFTDKPGVPLIYRALSSTFKNKLRFGIIRKDESDLVSNYNVKKFPTILVLKTGVKKPFVFTKEVNFKNLFDFMNIFSEQFVPTDQETNSETKSWLFEPVPELTGKSANDICLGLDKTLCIIVFNQGKPSAEVIDSLKALKSEFNSKTENSLAFKFMWIDNKKQSHWAKDLGVENFNKLSVRVLNPGRRKRFVKLDHEFSYASIKKLLEKITGGDARFINITKDLPKLVDEL